MKLPAGDVGGLLPISTTDKKGLMSQQDRDCSSVEKYFSGKKVLHVGTISYNNNATLTIDASAQSSALWSFAILIIGVSQLGSINSELKVMTKTDWFTGYLYYRDNGESIDVYHTRGGVNLNVSCINNRLTKRFTPSMTEIDELPSDAVLIGG